MAKRKIPTFGLTGRGGLGDLGGSVMSGLGLTGRGGLGDLASSVSGGGLGLTGRGGLGDLTKTIAGGLGSLGKTAYKKSQIGEVPNALGDLGGYIFDWNPQPDYNLDVTNPRTTPRINMGAATRGVTTSRPGAVPAPGIHMTGKPNAATGSIRAGFPMLEDWGKPGASVIPTPVPGGTTPSKTTSQPTASQADVLSSLQALLTPKTYGSLNLNIPQVQATDMMPIYQKYSPLMGAAYDTLISQLAAQRPGIEARDASTLQSAKDAWAASAAKTKASADASKQGIADLFNRLGRGEELTRVGGEQLDAKVNELAGLTNILTTSSSNTQSALNNARMGNLDTISSLASQSRAKGLNDLLESVAQGEITSQLTANKANAAARLAGATGEADYQKLLAGIRGQEVSQGLNIWQTLQRLQLAKEKAAAAGAAASGSTGTETTTSQNQPFWDAYQTLAQQNPTAGALMQSAWGQGGGDLSKAQAQLAKIGAGDYHGLTQGPGNPIERALGLVGGINRQLPEVSAAQQLLDLFTSTGTGGFGGMPVTTQKLTTKGKSPQ